MWTVSSFFCVAFPVRGRPYWHVFNKKIFFTTLVYVSNRSVSAALFTANLIKMPLSYGLNFAACKVAICEFRADWAVLDKSTCVLHQRPLSAEANEDRAEDSPQWIQWYQQQKNGNVVEKEKFRLILWSYSMCTPSFTGYKGTSQWVFSDSGLAWVFLCMSKHLTS